MSKKIVLTSICLLILSGASLLLPVPSQAQCPFAANNFCQNPCPLGTTCQAQGQSCFCLTAAADPNNPFGSITSPIPGTLIGLLSNVLRLIFVFAGVYSFIRIVLAGLAFIGAGGDPKKIEQAWNSIWQSLLGLVIIISSFAIAALAGQILFNDPTAILNPKIYGPGQSP